MFYIKMDFIICKKDKSNSFLQLQERVLEQVFLMKQKPPAKKQAVVFTKNNKSFKAQDIMHKKFLNIAPLR